MAIPRARRQINSPGYSAPHKFELLDFSEKPAIEVKNTIGKLQLTSYMENLYYILLAVTGNNRLA